MLPLKQTNKSQRQNQHPSSQYSGAPGQPNLARNARQSPDVRVCEQSSVLSKSRRHAAPFQPSTGFNYIHKLVTDAQPSSVLVLGS